MNDWNLRFFLAENGRIPGTHFNKHLRNDFAGTVLYPAFIVFSFQQNVLFCHEQKKTGNVVKTMSCLPPMTMTGNCLYNFIYTAYIFMVTGGW